ncbi:MAG: hypothetical protein AMJ45_02315 [Syntrophobacter sp. DG_60]|nr:MAG: hypothetical protein AMJ45_02315 [Syntrophobacter sp. DG_60]
MKLLEKSNSDRAEKLILNEIKKVVEELVPDSRIVLFGSRARGEATSESDWDILILTDNVTPEFKKKIRAALYEIELEEGIIINSLILTINEWEQGRFYDHPIHERVESEGVVIR